jgi:heat shock protein HtpX
MRLVDQVDFEGSRALQARMVAVLALNVLLLMVLAVAIVLTAVLGGWGILIWIAIIGLVGYRARAGRQVHAVIEGPERVRAYQSLQRLSIVAGVPAPELAVVSDPLPLSWTIAPRRKPPTIYLTTGLMAAASDDELAAVVAHELIHIVNRDAALMTLVASVPISLLRGGRQLRGRRWWRGWFLSTWLYSLPALVPLATSRLFSRQRELAADRGAAMLTGSPAAVESALLRFSGTLKGIPRTDLREAEVADVFHFLPATPEARTLTGRIWATHPPLATRLEQLERMELDLQQQHGV